MAQRQRMLRQKHVCVSLNELHAFLISSFDGFHFTHNNVGGISKTTLASINPQSRNCGATLATIIRRCNAHNVKDRPTNIARFVALLYNRGNTLQSRPDHMVLTRSVVVLVKGAHAAHAGTLCELEGYACLTEAYATVESSAINDVMTAIKRSVANSTPARNTVAAICSASVDTIKSIQQIFGLIQNKRRAPPVEAAVNVMLCAAVLHTGFSDAGAKFRDRAARQEGARNYGDSIKSFIESATTPV